MDDETAHFVLEAVDMVATHGWKLLPQVKIFNNKIIHLTARENELFTQYLVRLKHSYYKDLVRKPGKLQRNKQRSKDLCWKVHDPAQSIVLYSHPLAELRNRHVSIG